MHPGQWSLNLLRKQALISRLAAKDLLLQKIPAGVVVCTRFNKDGRVWATMDISNRLVDMTTKVTLRAQGVNSEIGLI